MTEGPGIATMAYLGGFWCEAWVWRIFGGELARDEPGQAC